MKHLVWVFILMSLFVVPCIANQAGIEVVKAVNGGYEWSAPIVLETQARVPFLPKAYLKATPIFTAPRSSFTTLNHSRMDMVIGSGFVLLGSNIEFETGATWWWAGNDQGMPEGWEWNNAFRAYYAW